MNLLTVDNISKTFTHRKLFDDTSFYLQEGEKVGIIGINGTGKSTLLKIIAGLEEPDAGEVIRANNLVIRYLPQMPEFRAEDTVLESVLSYAKTGSTHKAEVLEEHERWNLESTAKNMMTRLGIYDFEEKTGHLSGGQRKRLALVAVLLTPCDILLLDEPFSALDSYLKWELEQEMRDMLAEVQKPVLFVSHNRDEVYRLCSMVSCIDHGKMEVIEKTKEFFHNPKTKTAAVLSGCKNISAAEIVDNNHIKALGWGITLCVSEIPEETKAVGIRAHSFYPVNAEQIPGKESAANESRVSVIQEGTGLKKYRNPVQEENIFKIEESRIIEDPFEWNISFRPSKESGWLQWKIAKTEQEDSPGPIPPALAVHAKDILLLKDNAYE